MLVILPGVGRPASMLAFWADLLPQPVEALDYPRIPTLHGLIDHFEGRLDPETLVVGESLGGLVALGLAGRGFRAMAFDPPLTMAKQWAVQYAVRTTLAAYGPNHAAHAMAESIFGVMPDGRQEERIYYHLLDALPHRTTIVTGDVPLWPYRVAFGRACSIDEADRYVIACKANVEFRQIAGPHALLTESVEASRAEILRWLGANKDHQG